MVGGHGFLLLLHNKDEFIQYIYKMLIFHITTQMFSLKDYLLSVALINYLLMLKFLLFWKTKMTT